MKTIHPIQVLEALIEAYREIERLESEANRMQGESEVTPGPQEHHEKDVRLIETLREEAVRFRERHAIDTQIIGGLHRKVDVLQSEVDDAQERIIRLTGDLKACRDREDEQDATRRRLQEAFADLQEKIRIAQEEADTCSG